MTGAPGSVMSQTYIYDSRATRRITVLILVAIVSYQALLCLVNTHAFGVSRALVGVSEGLIILASLPLLFKRIVPGIVIFAALAAAMLCLLTILSGVPDIKAFRDLLIPICFFWLGRNIGDPALADRAMLFIVFLIMAFGFFELLAVDAFTNVFDIFSYYVSIGNLEPITEYVRESRLQMNGIRPEDIGRTLLPGLLDNHRVSSLFLEPVSLGNFATILAAWGLAKEREQMRWTAFFVGSAVLLIVLADSRFALVSVSLLVAMRLILNGRGLYAPVIIPFALLVLLVGLGIYATGPYTDSYLGRLINSGESLVRFDVSTLLGYDSHAWFPDQGYAYALSTFGLPLVVALWMAFWLVKMPDSAGQRFRCFAAVYIALILCISGTSLFALKTAGLLWFLFGCIMRDPAPAPETQQKQKSEPLWDTPIPVLSMEAKV